MRYVYFFNLKELINIDNYYDFLEIYLKENHILKKDFFKKTGIAANSYRFFLKNKEKNKYYYYDIISREYGINIPNDNKLYELSCVFSKIIEDILYMRIDKKEQDIRLIDSNLDAINENCKSIKSIVGLAFKALRFYLDVSFSHYSYTKIKSLFNEFYNIAKPYKDLFHEEYRLFLLMIKMYGDSIFNHTIVNTEIEESINLSRRYIFLQPLVYKVISDVYYYCNDYLNATIFGTKAYNGFVQVSNFQRAVYVKINIAYSLILLGSYHNAYETFYSLFLSYDTYNDKYKKSIIRGIIECLILLEKFDEAYSFIKDNDDIMNQDEWKIEYLIILYKLNKIEEFNIVFNDVKDCYDKNQFFEPYFFIALEICNLINGEKASKELSCNLSKLHNLSFVNVCKKTLI